MIIYATRIPGRCPDTDNPRTGNDHRLYYTSTEKFEKFFKSKIFYNEDFNVIDGTIDKISSKYYIFSKDAGNNPLIAQ